MKQFLIAVLGILSVTFGAAIEAQAERIYALTTAGSLINFDSATPGTVSSSAAITGLQAGESLVGIDFRPANGQLYAAGTSNRLYTLNLTTGAASLASALSTPLNGSAFGFDFNPVVDRLRVTSNTDQNLRVNVDTGATIVDGTLAFAAGDARVGQNPNIVGSAYSNNVAGATSTVLRGIDSTADILVIQDPPNAGTLNSSVALGVNTSELVGYDISGLTGIPYVSLTAPGAASSQLYTLSANGATLIGTIGGVSTIQGLSATPVPEPSTILLFATGLAGVAAAARKRRLRH